MHIEMSTKEICKCHSGVKCYYCGSATVVQFLGNNGLNKELMSKWSQKRKRLTIPYHETP